MGTAPTVLATVECGDRRHVVVGELEVEDVEVLLHPRRGDRLGEDDVAALDVPAERNLGGGTPQAVGDAGDRGVVGHLAAGDRSPCLYGDVVPGAGRADVLVAEERVYLDLVQDGNDAGLGDDAVQVVGFEVGDPDRRNSAVLDELGHRPPGRDEVAVVA